MHKMLLAAALLLASLPSLARAQQDRASFGSDITVAEGESSGDIACAFCSVHVHGDVHGDVAVLFGSVSVDSNHSISGDVAILGGNLNLGEQSEIGGDLALAAGDANLAAGASIRGAQNVLPGKLWLVLPFAPLLILIGIIWLIVYLVRRSRYRYPTYPSRPGY